MQKIIFIILVFVPLLFARAPVVSNVHVNQSDISSDSGAICTWQGMVTFDVQDTAIDTVYIRFTNASSFGAGCSLRVTAGDSACDAFCEPLQPFPRRVITYEDMEVRHNMYCWGIFGSHYWGKEVPGTFNRRTLYNEPGWRVRGTVSAAVGNNACPGPRCENINRMFFMYRYTGTRLNTMTVQMYNMDEADNYHMTVPIIKGQWASMTVDWKNGVPNSGGGDGFQAGERMDEITLYMGYPWDNATDTIFLDNIILYAPEADSVNAVRNMVEPMPRRVGYIGSFETGTKAEHWPGEYELTQTGVSGAYYAFARAIANPLGGKYVKLDLQGVEYHGRYASNQTRLMFRYFIKSASKEMKIQFIDSLNTVLTLTYQVILNNLASEQWQWAMADFTNNATESHNFQIKAGASVDYIVFKMDDAQEGDEFYVDEVTLYEPR